ncbi:nucleic-acid-binding protein from transposon X-element [Trichonephila clavipes]|nr:nucleic-acid-binding protein from transposon X-element [Trichonephila clavipes]
MASTTDEHREISAALKAQGEEFYSVPDLSERSLKVVIKGLPKSTPTAEIKEDLLNQGVPVMKVSQLTQRKSKFPLPIFLVELRKHVEGATDIYDISKCCYISANCFMKPRCLKCSKEHRTGECPIKERLATPHCINCDKDGHPANWRNCPAFPKIKNKKGAPAENRNKATPKTFTSKLATPAISYANATSNSHQMAAPIDRTETAKKSNSKPESNKKEEPTSFNEYISAMAEFRKFFKDYPGIVDAGKAFKNAKTNEDRLDIFFGVLTSEGTHQNNH